MYSYVLLLDIPNNFIGIIISLMLIPALYNLIFLSSMWDPYGKLSDLSVAVVNQDKSAQLNGKAIDVADNEAKLTVNKKGSYTITATAHDEAGNNSSVELHFNYGSKINWLLIAIIGGGVLLIAIILLLLLRRRKDS